MLDLDSLNREQLQAVVTTDGPLLVLAGAGSGKTRVVTYRLAYLLRQGVEPRNILCVTFTNKAAFEMKQRARSLVGRSLKGAAISTFHALGSRILREHAEPAGLRSGFTITDGADQLGSVRRILRELRIDERRFDAKRILSVISRAKNAGLDGARFRELEARIGGELPPELSDEEYVEAAIEAYERYEASLRAQNVVDFDDLLLLTQILLERNDEVREKLRDRWRYLMVDEYQDTNGAQFALMKLLAGERRNLCVVGDDDQSIYGWRGADVSNILRFGDDFPGAQTVKLEANYRSTANILSVANSIIEKNSARHDKTLRATGSLGDPIRVVQLADEEAEAEWVAARILDLTGRGTVPKDIAILFRSNVQSRPIELALRSLDIAYRLVGGLELFDKREIKDLIAYLRFLDNPDDEQSMRRIINFPPRGIGAASLGRIDDWARAQGQPLLAGLERASEIAGVSPKAALATHAFLELCAEHRKLIGRRKPSTIAKKLVEAVELERVLLESSDSAQAARRRVDNVRGVLRQVERYETRTKKRARFEEPPEATEEEDDDDWFAEEDRPTLSGFLADIALGGKDDDSRKDQRDDQVVLSTIHAAKGLEWEQVFVVGVEEDLLPHARTTEEGGGDVSEERRLAYVAVTRARKFLTVTWAKNRTKWGKVVTRTRSRFLEALPPDAVRYEGEGDVPRSEEEKDAIAREYMDQIKKRLGM